jgi:protein farnesyltransferase subunit beta
MRGRAIATIMAKQHPNGGFGGGPGQIAHILPTYASVCSLAIVGHKGEGGGWDQIDRLVVGMIT